MQKSKVSSHAFPYTLFSLHPGRQEASSRLMTYSSHATAWEMWIRASNGCCLRRVCVAYKGGQTWHGESPRGQMERTGGQHSVPKPVLPTQYDAWPQIRYVLVQNFTSKCRQGSCLYVVLNCNLMAAATNSTHLLVHVFPPFLTVGKRSPKHFSPAFG